jgi:hypothetical protein
MQLIHLETLLNNAFNSIDLTPEEEAMIAAYEYQCVMLDHAEDLEDFDYWSIRKEVGEVRAWS